jgi:hypothetical protein
VRDSDATLILCLGEPSGGTALTIKYCEKLGRPFYVHRMNSEYGTYVDGEDFYSVVYWFNCHDIQVLNVAGPGGGKYFPVYGQAHSFLSGVFRLLLDGDQNVCEPCVDYISQPSAVCERIVNEEVQDVWSYLAKRNEMDAVASEIS